MRKTFKTIVPVIFMLMVAVMFSGCEGASYSMTGSPNKIKIEVSADDGKYGEGFVMDISKNEVINVDCQLEKGALQIEFMEVINMATADEPDDYQTIDTIKTVTVEPGDNLEFPLDYIGDFMPVLTSIGQTSGTVTISVVKQ